MEASTRRIVTTPQYPQAMQPTAGRADEFFLIYVLAARVTDSSSANAANFSPARTMKR